MQDEYLDNMDSGIATYSGSAVANGDILCVALDVTNKKVLF
jgi:predicted RecA/RadA family phage recombinase